MQRGFDFEPRRDAVRCLVRRHLACESAVGRAVDGESETNAIRIESSRQQSEMTDDENGGGQRHMEGARNKQPA